MHADTWWRGNYVCFLYPRADLRSQTISRCLEKLGKQSLQQGFFKKYLDWLVKAENDGCNVKGYYAWSSTDCYSWINGYEKRYGLIYVDFNDPERKRTPKKSYYWFKDYINEHTEK